MAVALITISFLILLLLYLFRNKTTAIKNKKVLIIGGSSGLGLSMAKYLFLYQNDITITSRNKERANDKIKEFPKILGSEIRALAFDSTDISNIEVSKITSYDYIFYCAGISQPGYFQDQKIEHFTNQMSINYFGMVNSLYFFINRNNTPFTFVMINSTASLLEIPGYGSYSPSKRALTSFYKSIRDELINKQIYLKMLYPSAMKTLGFINENKTKPRFTLLVERMNKIYSPDVYSKYFLDNISTRDSLCMDWFTYFFIIRDECHVDSGKSTLCGRIVHEWGKVDNRALDKLQKIADENAKSSFAFAYFTDKTKQERERGVTINTTLVQVESKKFRINFLDCPGHADYLKNATSGCKQSDLSVVVVPANFQASCSEDGTLKTHLTLAAVLGSKNFIVCINKIDEVAAQQKEDCKTIFDAACAAVGKLLSRVGVDKNNTVFLPISALLGYNLFSGKLSYDFFPGHKLKTPKNGYEVIHNLEEAIDSQDVPARPIDSPLRMPISSIAHVPGQGVIFCGRVDYGRLLRNDNIKFLPVSAVGTVKNIQAHCKDVESGDAGMNIGFNAYFKDTKNKVETKIAAGQMVGPASADFANHSFYVVSCMSLKGKGKAGADEKGIKAGYTPVISCGTSNIATKFVKILECTTKDKITTKNPTFVPKDAKFTALVYPTKPAVFESVKNFPALGKFVCRDSGHLVAAGQIVECLTEEEAVKIHEIDMQEVLGIKPTSAQGKKAKK